jgi:hypothetical protein
LTSQVLRANPSTIKPDTSSKQFSPDDGIWPKEKPGLFIIKDIKSAEEALNIVMKGFNPEEILRCKKTGSHFLLRHTQDRFPS